MSTSLTGIGSVNKGKITVAVIVGMAEAKLKGLILEIDWLIDLTAIDFFSYKILKTVGGIETLIIKVQVET
jgi:hypothetical protein